MKRKVFQLITSLQVGGAEAIVREIVRGLAPRYDLRVGYLKEFGATGAEIRELGVTPRRLTTASLAGFLRSWKPDVLHTHLYRAQLLGGWLGALTGVPARIGSRWAQDRWRTLPWKYADRLTSPLFHHFVTNSESTK